MPYTRHHCILGSGYVVIIAEKPKAGRRIAEALAGRGLVECRRGGIPYWVFRRDGIVYVVAPAAGHLFGLTTDESGFPVFNYYWAPLWQIDPSAKHTRRFFELLRILLQRARLAINACDYDIEGSVIGYLIIKSFFDPRRARRMKFSALTPTDIRRAFARLEPLDWSMIEAGLARHELDWLWGINVSRALMDSVKLVTGQRPTLSAGRVQSPTLIEAARRDRERRLHVPLPRFAVEATIVLNGFKQKLRLAVYDALRDAESLANYVKRTGFLRVVNVRRRVIEMPPPPPFNLGDLQAEAARIYGYSPMKTQEIAEQLYLEALISYPRTNSQKIPPTVDIVSILKGLMAIEKYRGIVRSILSRSLRPRPREGSKEDPAHPAIHPTGAVPSRRLSREEERIYDLVVRRFLASMMPPARIATLTITLAAGSVRTSLSGVKVLFPGWFEAYPFSAPREQEVPDLKPGDIVRVERVYVKTEYTGPPDPYTKASLVRWMESQGIGTESTRARIVEILFDRGYLRLRGRSVEVTDLGFTVAEVLAKYFPQLTSVKLTRYFEEKLERIRRGVEARSTVVAEARKVLSALLSEFKAYHMKEVGIELAKSLGLIPPTQKCLICRREAYRDGLCRFHFEALERIRKAYAEWRRRIGSITFTEYVSRLTMLKETGSWVREVAKYLAKTGKSYTYKP